VELLNRIALVVTPKRRFLEWVNRLPDAGKPLTIEEAASLRMVYLAVPPGDRLPPLRELIEVYWQEIFEDSLDGWTDDESLWPSNRTPHVFQDWFHFDYIDGVGDADPGEPLTIRELARTRCAACDAELDSAAIAVVAFADRSVRRMTVQQLDTLNEREIGTDDENPLRLVFRCCQESCAEQIEKGLAEAHADD
jgi:hypothetical protein